MACCGQQHGGQNRHDRTNTNNYNDGNDNDDDYDDDEDYGQVASSATERRRFIKSHRASTPEQHPCQLIIIITLFHDTLSSTISHHNDSSLITALNFTLVKHDYLAARNGS